MFLLIRRECPIYSNFSLQFNRRPKGLVPDKNGAASPSSVKALPSPHLGSVGKTKLGPLSTFIKNSPQLRPATDRFIRSSSLPKPFQKKVTLPSKMRPDDDNNGAQTGRVNLAENEDRKFPLPQSQPAPPIEEKPKERTEGASPLVFCACGNKCPEGSTECQSCESATTKQHEYAGYLYENAKAGSEELVRYYYVLLGRELFRMFPL